MTERPGSDVGEGRTMIILPLRIERLKRLFAVCVRLQRSCFKSGSNNQKGLFLSLNLDVPKRVAEWHVSRIACDEFSANLVVVKDTLTRNRDRAGSVEIKQSWRT